MASISFVSEGYKLAGNLLTASTPKNTAFLLIQGWRGHQNLTAAQALAESGYTSMTYDMRGNGDSEGDIAEFSRADFLRDAIVAYDHLRGVVGDNVRIGVIGSSFGCYIAALLTQQRDVYCLSFRVPASYPDDGFDQPQLAQNKIAGLMEWRKKTLDYTENRAFSALHDFSGKVQVIEAEADEMVPSQTPRNYAATITDKNKLAYEIMSKAPHGLHTPELFADYTRRLMSWVDNL